MNQSTKPTQNRSKDIQSDNFCFHNVGRAITKWGSICREKSDIAIAILEKFEFLKGKKNYLDFDGSNNIFADCRLKQRDQKQLCYFLNV